MSSQQPSLRVQITQIDHALIQPGSLDNSSLPRVPIIRIYGASSLGKKTCLHIHQVYPYFFVEYSGRLTSTYVNRYISRLTQSLNHAIALSLKRNPRSPGTQYIRAILLVKGIHFYGFHSSYSPFLKILVADPAYVNRVATILQSGTVMSTRFRVFESHLSYILQFMCDFGLYGCGWIDLQDVLQRDSQDSDREETSGLDSTNTSFGPSPYFRQSRMPLEVDAIAPQILNRHRLTARNIHHKLEIPVPPFSDEPLIMSIRELWEDERSRRVAHGLSPSPEIPVDPSDSVRGRGGEWVAEAQWWDELRKKIEADRAAGDFLQRNSSNDWENWAMTTFESLEAIWEQPWKVWKPVQGNKQQATLNLVGDSSSSSSQSQPNSWDAAEQVTAGYDENSDTVEVDISMLSSEEMSQMVDFEDAEGVILLGGDERRLDDDPDHDVLDDDETGFLDDEDRLSAGSQEVELATGLLDPFQQEYSISELSEEATFILPSPPRLPTPYNLSDMPATPTHMWADGMSLFPSESPDSTHETRQTSAEEARPPTIMEEEGASTQEFSVKESLGALQPEMTFRDHNQPPEALLQIDSVVQPRPLKGRKFNFSELTEEIPQDRTFFSSPSPYASQIPQPKPAVENPIRKSYDAFRNIKTLNMNRYTYTVPPPTISDLLGSLDEHNIPSKIYHPPYYLLACDVPDKPREYGGLVYHLKGGGGITDLEPWDTPTQPDLPRNVMPLISAGVGGWEYASSPPSIKDIRRWLSEEEPRFSSSKSNSKLNSQIEGPTQKNVYGLKNTLGVGVVPSNLRERQPMNVLSLEVFVPVRKDKVPDANVDEIVAVFYAHQISDTIPPQKGTIVIETPRFQSQRIRDDKFEVVPNELELINKIVDFIVDFDPDVILGWDVQRSSWGYLEERAQQYGLSVGDLISRAPTSRGMRTDQWGMRHTSTFKVAGRHVLNLWRIMRSEQTLTSYTLENVAFSVLQKRIPRYSNLTLTEWYNSSVPGHAAGVLHYFSERTLLLLEILEMSEIITKTAEFARVFGVDFFSVLSRGSQFKVESFMFRIAKPESFVLISPSKQDVGKQNAAECMPLIMEPMSSFYSSPLLVLDFQSLYPSIMIAYNYCYSTCLGRIKDFEGRNKFGVVDLDQPPGLLASLSDHIHVAPNGMVYVKPEVRKGLLGRMLTELLKTRVMVKQAMKGIKNDKALQRILDARQLSLKYIANVTYGYTGATYSGRMPAVEIADSIVQSGRETLEKAIMLIDETKKWGAKVVYGDTDSVFVYLQGKTKEQAFRIGNDIADTITALNPSPVKLKFEKVYLPCVLIAKKRYVGFKFEHIDDCNAVFDAKGIETVRRDGVYAQQKMTENCLKILFRSQDLSEVKDYCFRSWTKLLDNKASVQDFIFAKEVRMGTYSNKGPPPPGVTVAARRIVGDPNNEPQYGERVPYVIIRGPPNSRLVDRAVDPMEVLNDSQLHLDATYYISRVLIPPLERIFNLVGADVRRWFDEMPKTYLLDLPSSPTKAKDGFETPDRLNIDAHFHSSQCLICGGLASQGLCDECYFSPQKTMARLSARIQSNENRLIGAHRICTTCTGSEPGEPIRCESLDCSWLYSRKRAEHKQEFLEIIEELLEDLEVGEEADSPIEFDDQLTMDREDDDYEMEYLLQTP